MYKQTRAVGAAALAVMCASCAKHSTGPGLTLSPSEARWSGAILPTDQNNGTVEGAGRKMINGQAELIADADYPNRTKIDITLGTPSTNTTVLWALVPDRCGTGGVSVLPVNAFSPIEVGPSGRGEVTVVIPFELPTQGSFHIDIYQARRATLADVQACAELKMHKR